MKERYRKVCNTILEHYADNLLEYEINILKKIIKLNKYDNEEIIIFINKIIDRIWNMTLTAPNEYVEGKPFVFLTTKDAAHNVFNKDLLKKINEQDKYSLELITNETILNTSVGINGLIVQIDFLNNPADPVLPIDFQPKKPISVKGNIDIKGIYNISLNLSNYDINEELSDEFASLLYSKKININKPLYYYLEKQKIMSKLDEEILVETILIYYLCENNFKDVIGLRNQLRTNYKNIIIAKYKEFFKNKISLEEFVTYIFNLLDNEPLLVNVDKLL